MYISISEPESKEEVIKWHSEEQRRGFGDWKKELSKYGHGCKSLISNLEKAKKFENFIEYLAEFNIARIFKTKGLEFDYEKPGYDDFLLPKENFEISVKSLMPKSYQPREKAIILRLLEQAKKDGMDKEEVIDYKHSQVIIRVKPNGDFERSETNNHDIPGSVLYTEMQQKSTLIKNIRKFDQKASDKRKIMFFFVQNQDCPPVIFYETIDYYYKGIPMPHDQSPYSDYFGGELRRDIAGFIFFYRPNNILCWDKDCMSDFNIDGTTVLCRFNVIAPKDITEELNKIFV
ncbi:MAG: hypothetical protein WC719_03015 [Patescibacteria group bacterium]|jgi:hypothetical protein